MKRIAVLIADDHAVVRAGVVAMLARDAAIEVVGECSSGEEAMAGIAAKRPDVVIADIGMADMSGIEVARKVRDASLRTAVVMLSVHAEPAFVRAAINAGASGYVLKDAAGADLLAAVRAAAQGDMFLSPRIAAIAISTARATDDGDVALTERERDVLRLLARGLSSKEIATALGIGVRTIDSHRAAIMDKLNVRNVPGLVKYALRHQLASLDE